MTIAGAPPQTLTWLPQALWRRNHQRLGVEGLCLDQTHRGWRRCSADVGSGKTIGWRSVTLDEKKRMSDGMRFGMLLFFLRFVCWTFGDLTTPWSESRWLTTPIGLSWPLTVRHRTWELRSPSTFQVMGFWGNVRAGQATYKISKCGILLGVFGDCCWEILVGDMFWVVFSCFFHPYYLGKIPIFDYFFSNCF